jgi:AhpD family alkylhydroperoxidase
MANDDTCIEKPVWTLDRLANTLVRLPSHLIRVLPSLAGRVLSNELRERVMLAVAAENRCRYCIAAHTELGLAAGLTREEIGRILAGDDAGFDASIRAALAFSRDLVRRDFRSRSESLYDALIEQYGSDQAAAIEAAAHVMNFFNRFGNTFDMGLAKVSGRCETLEASWLDLAAVSSVFLSVAPWVAGPIAMLAAVNKIRS